MPILTPVIKSALAALVTTSNLMAPTSSSAGGQVQFAATVPVAAQQSAKPKFHTVHSFSEYAGLTIRHSNKSGFTHTYRIAVTDDQLVPIRAEVFPPLARVKPDEMIRFHVVLPFSGDLVRHFSVCLIQDGSGKTIFCKKIRALKHV